MVALYSDGSEVSSADFDFDVTVRSGLTAHSEMSKAHFDFGLTVRCEKGGLHILRDE
jgi:hypothetical protein